MKKLILLTALLLPFLFTYSQVRIGSYDGDSHAVVYNNGWGNGDSYIHIGNNAGVDANSTGTYFTNIGYAAYFPIFFIACFLVIPVFFISIVLLVS